MAGRVDVLAALLPVKQSKVLKVFSMGKGDIEAKALLLRITASELSKHQLLW